MSFSIQLSLQISAMKQLSTSDLTSAFKDDTDFLSVFEINQLPDRVKIGMIKLITNLQPSNLPGNHWVALFRRSEDSVGFYFDSFGHVPPLAIQAWLFKNCTDWSSNRLTIQPYDDNALCGYLCIIFFKHL